jgi:hypothetical protein
VDDTAAWELIEWLGDQCEPGDDLLSEHGVGQPSDWGDFKSPLFCTECMVDYPCPTIAALAERLGRPPTATSARTRM